MKTVKISTFNNVLIDENKKIERNSITRNDEFERVGDETTLKHIKKIFFSNVNNSTNKRNFLRFCRIVNFIDYQAQNVTFHQQRLTFFINTFDEILQTYEQLFHV